MRLFFWGVYSEIFKWPWSSCKIMTSFSKSDHDFIWVMPYLAIQGSLSRLLLAKCFDIIYRDFARLSIFYYSTGPNLEIMGRVLMFRKRARQCPMHVSQMRVHYSWGGGWGAVNLKISCYVLRCLQWSGSGKKTAKMGTNIQSEDTSTSRNNKVS